VAAAAATAAADLAPPSDLHGTSAYRRHVAAVMVRRALEQAISRANGAA
jgi:carbon-monoxide dehydrogenase medium subunit